MAIKNFLSFMHNLNVDKKYFTMGTFDDDMRDKGHELL